MRACTHAEHGRAIATAGIGYGLQIVRLTMAAYMSAERGSVVDLSDEATCEELEAYVPLIQQGRGREVLEVPSG